MIFWRRRRMPDYALLARLEVEHGVEKEYYQGIAALFSLDCAQFVTGSLSVAEQQVLEAMGYAKAEACLSRHRQEIFDTTPQDAKLEADVRRRSHG